MSIAHFVLYYCYICAEKSIYLSQVKWFSLHIVFGENLQEIDIFVKTHYISQYKYLSYA